jgi:predicted phosphodiesterase
MRIAVISDVHGNLEALRQVLSDIERSGIDAILCLGDNIGYGPEPEAVVQLVRRRKIPCVLGNHELAVLKDKVLDWFNPAAKKSLLITIDMLSDDTMQYLSGLPTCRTAFGCRFVHGFPPDSAVLYLFEISEHVRDRTFRQMAERICFVGHTHELLIVSSDGAGSTYEPLHAGSTSLKPENKYIISVGSVGQPRDGDNRAKYVIFDTSNDAIDVRFIPYDIASVAKKILAAGLPEVHAAKLY